MSEKKVRAVITYQAPDATTEKPDSRTIELTDVVGTSVGPLYTMFLESKDGKVLSHWYNNNVVHSFDLETDDDNTDVVSQAQNGLGF